MVVYWWPKQLAPLHEQTKSENIDKKNKIKEVSQTNSFKTFLEVKQLTVTRANLQGTF